MGCCVSKVEKQETVCRCKSRKRYLKHFLHARHSLSSAHSLYLHSLRSTGAALLHFSTSLHHHHHHHLPPLPPSPPRLPSTLPPPPPPPPPPMSPSTDTWTTTSTTTSSANPQPHPPPPPPPPPGAGSTWDFWDPFAASPAPATRSGTEEEWEDATTESAVREVGAAASVSGVSKETEEMAVVAVAARQGKDIVEIMKELEEYFVKAAEGGSHVSCLLEVPHFSTLPSPFQSTPGNKVYNYGRSWSPMQWSQWGSTAKSNGYAKFVGEGVGNVIPVGNRGINVNGNPTTASSHCSTVERLYAWEKKLFLEVKSAETIRAEQEKKGEQVRKLEVKKKADYIKIEKAKKEVEKLESQLEVASQAIQSTSFEIIKFRETQLYPQLLLLVNGLMCMWRSMYECHQVQMHIVDQLKYLNTFSPSTEPTSELHRQSTLQLELELQQWHHSFVNLVKAQRSYVQSLTGWLRLSLFEFNKNRSSQDSSIYSLCEEWQQAIEHVPDKVAAEGIKSLLTVVHAIVVQQGEEQKQKKKSEAANKELEKRAAQLRALEGKYGPYSTSRSTKGRDPVEEKRAKVAALKVKAEEEKGKHEKAVSVTRAMTLNNLQMGLPHVFQAITGFSSVCMRGYESVYNMAKIMEQQQRQQQLQPEVKMLMPPSDVRSYR